jgi:hypothetical protein
MRFASWVWGTNSEPSSSSWLLGEHAVLLADGVLTGPRGARATYTASLLGVFEAQPPAARYSPRGAGCGEEEGGQEATKRPSALSP